MAGCNRAPDREGVRAYRDDRRPPRDVAERPPSRGPPRRAAGRGDRVRPAADGIGDFMRAGGASAMGKLLAGRTTPRAVFCANDLMAIGAMDAIREAGLHIPDDVALVGYDDIEAASLVTPDLTTVVNPAYEIGRECGRLLLERMTGRRDGTRVEVVVPHRLVPRTSA
ncbi:MAG: substrate-binding domain-containing protein [Actinomycetota bacterium]|nr:substrate-binding domain-containing protein [Actinomycetota bacterium]